MSDSHRFFGYGSLVNRDTHDYPGAHGATLVGWRRTWQRTTLRDVSFLSVTPDPQCQIDGLVAQVPGGDWAALDERERAYDKHTAETSSGRVKVYAVSDGLKASGAENTILLSYLDVVVQGFLREFGEAGVDRFFETTDGWGGVKDDRAAPIYARARVLVPAERALVDRWLARVS